MNHTSQERLRLQAGMVGNLPLTPRCPLAENHVLKGLVVRCPPQAACLPTTQAFAHGRLRWHRFAKYSPRFVATLGHRRYAGKLAFRILRSISTPQCADQPDKLAAKLQSSIDQSVVEQLSNESIGGDENVAAGTE